MLNNYLVCKHLVDTKIYVDPRKVTLHGGSRTPVARFYQRNVGNRIARLALGRLLHPLRPFLIPDHIPINHGLIAAQDTCLLVRDLIANKAEPESSIWARRLCREIETNGVAAYKSRQLHSPSEALQFLKSYLVFPIADLQENGWREDVSDVGTAIVSASGDLLKTGSGNHRFVAAQALGLRRVPLQIVGICQSYFYACAPPPLTIGKLRSVIEDVQARYA